MERYGAGIPGSPEVFAIMTFGGKQAKQPGMARIFSETLKQVREYASMVYVVDDGTRTLCLLEGALLKSLPSSIGKAGAVRTALQMIMKGYRLPRVIIQIDYDQDQTPADIPLLIEVMEATNSQMVIGNRHAPHPDLLYRERVNLVQSAIAEFLGYKKLTDIVSGLRVYSGEFAYNYLRHSRESSGWQIESEMFIIGALLKFGMVTVPLTETRRRDTFTPRLKVIENIEGMLLFEDQLVANGYGKVVDLLRNVRSELLSKTPQFSIDLSPLRKPVVLTARLLEGDLFTLTDS